MSSLFFLLRVRTSIRASGPAGGDGEQRFKIKDVKTPRSGGGQMGRKDGGSQFVCDEAKEFCCSIRQKKKEEGANIDFLVQNWEHVVRITRDSELIQ